MAAEDHVARSFECKLFYATGGIGGTPTWVEAPGVATLTLTPTAKESDVTVRGMGGFAGTEPTIFDVTIEYNMPYVRGDPVRLVFEQAFYNRTLLGIAAMDEDVATTGASGLWADMKVFSIPRDESIDKTVDQKFTLKPCYPSSTAGVMNKPQYKLVA
jgi:hypothetical protein